MIEIDSRLRIFCDISKNQTLGKTRYRFEIMGSGQIPMSSFACFAPTAICAYNDAVDFFKSNGCILNGKNVEVARFEKAMGEYVEKSIDEHNMRVDEYIEKERKKKDERDSYISSL